MTAKSSTFSTLAPQFPQNTDTHDFQSQVPTTENLHVRETRLVPNRAATFKGSFAAGQRDPDPGDEDGGIAHVSKNVGRIKAIRLYFTHGWTDPGIWRSAFIELMASMTLCYLSAFIDTTITNFGTAQAAAYAGVTNIILLSLLIYAISPVSGGHINPLITFTTVLTGLTGFSRGVLYMTGQTIGGCIAGGLIRGSLGRAMMVKYVHFGFSANAGLFDWRADLGIGTMAEGALLPRIRYQQVKRT